MAGNIVEMHVVPRYYYLLKDGQKTVEGRLCDGEALPVKVGTIISMHTDADQDQPPLDLHVTRIEHYPSFAEYLATEGLERCLPGCPSLDEGVKVYRTFYTEAQEQKHGILAFEVKCS